MQKCLVEHKSEKDYNAMSVFVDWIARTRGQITFRQSGEKVEKARDKNRMLSTIIGKKKCSVCWKQESVLGKK